MPIVIDARVGRRALLAIVVVGTVAAFVALYAIGRGGAASEETTMKALDRLAKV